MDKKRLLIITAHPDDAELMFGGTISKYKKKGNMVDIIIVTNGENWNRLGINDSAEIISIRKAEAKKAAKVLGVDNISFLNMKDGLVESKELITVLIGEIRKSNPNIILSHSKAEGHPDHKQVSIAVRRVCNQLGEPAPIVNPFLKYEEKPVSDFEGVFTFHLNNEGVHSSTRYLSLEKEDIEKKIEAVLCHKSQFTEIEKTRDRILTEAHFNGISSGVEYAEVFDIVTAGFPVGSEMLID